MASEKAVSMLERTPSPQPRTLSRLEIQILRTRELRSKAEQLLAEVDEACALNNRPYRRYPQFDPKEIKVGGVLGVGGSGIVFEIKQFDLRPPVTVQLDTSGDMRNISGEDDEPNIQACGRSFPAPNVMGLPASSSYHGNRPGVAVLGTQLVSQHPRPRNSTDESQSTTTTTGTVNHDFVDQDDTHYDVRFARKIMWETAANGERAYAVKRLNTRLSDLEKIRGTIDLAIEAKLLASLWHANIVKMRGTAITNPLNPHFFIIMDKLEETLAERMDVWVVRQNTCQGSMFGVGADKVEVRKLLRERLLVMHDLVAAFCYLHESKIVYRDIRPENVGFDQSDHVKVFDLGLCKSLLPSMKAKDTSYGYLLTPLTGAVPYMAPEVVERKPYDFKADVFSFAILLWEVMALKKPFEHYSKREFLDRVVRAKERLNIHRQWPGFTRQAIKEAWDHDPLKRPSMNQMGAYLKNDLQDLKTTVARPRDRVHNDGARSSHSLHVLRNKISALRMGESK